MCSINASRKLSLEPRHRCESVVAVIRTVTTERLVQNLVIIALMRVTAELTQWGSVRLTVVGWSVMFVIK